MIRAQLLSFTFALVCCLSPGMAEDVALMRHERVSSWHTTVLPDAGSARSVVSVAPAPTRKGTGAIPSAVAISPAIRPAGAAPRNGGAHLLSGIASFYWQEQQTASGERFDKTAMTAAHPTLPFNTRVKVTHLASKRAVVVRINDRGPFKSGRVIDLSHAAAGALGMHGQGLARVQLEIVE
jgi:rare lipoprotein A